MATRDQIQVRVEEILLDDPPVVVGRIPDLINDAIEELEDAHLWAVNKKEKEYITTEDVHELGDLPSDWLEHYDLPYYVDGLGGWREMGWIERQSNITNLYNEDPNVEGGVPRDILIENDKAFVYPKPNALNPVGPVRSDGNWIIRLPYKATQGRLDQPNSENWFSQNAKNFLIWHSAANALLLNRNATISAPWFAKAESEKRRLIRDEKKANLDRNPILAPRKDVYGANKSRRRRGLRGWRSWGRR